MNALSPLTDYLVTGQPPEGVRPEIMDKLLKIEEMLCRN